MRTIPHVNKASFLRGLALGQGCGRGHDQGSSSGQDQGSVWGQGQGCLGFGVGLSVQTVSEMVYSGVRVMLRLGSGFRL